MERAGPERVVEAARHAAGPFGRLGLALDHLPGRGPGRPFGLAPDIRVAVPPEPVATDIGAVASGGSVALDAVDVVIAGIDDDRAGPFLAVVANRPAMVFRIDLADVDRGNREFL